MKLNKDIKCTECNSENIYFTGSSHPTSPPTFKHRCFNCGNISHLRDYKTLSGFPQISCMNNAEVLSELKTRFKLPFDKLSKIITDDWKEVLSLISINIHSITDENVVERLNELKDDKEIVVTQLGYVQSSVHYSSMLATLRKYYCL